MFDEINSLGIPKLVDFFRKQEGTEVKHVFVGRSFGLPEDALAVLLGSDTQVVMVYSYWHINYPVFMPNMKVQLMKSKFEPSILGVVFNMETVRDAFFVESEGRYPVKLFLRNNPGSRLVLRTNKPNGPGPNSYNIFKLN